VVDVRTPKINATEQIRLKERELKYLNWDNKLTLEFNGDYPCVSEIEIREADLPTIFLAGNSTVTDQENEPWASWGQMFPCFLKPEAVVANYAESGESLRSFRGEKRLQKLLSMMKSGDYLFIEFAHNDQKQGGSHVEAFTTYKDELKFFIDGARKKGGKPVLVTSMHRRRFDDNGQIINTLENYPEAMRQTAIEENVPLIDLNAMSKQLYEALGPENSKKAFVHYPANTYPGQVKALADDTHFNPYGAYELAKCIAESIRKNNPDLAKYLVDGLPAFDPEHPDPVNEFYWYESPSMNLIKPDGN
jgi:lysophospholipase L1-like esterase